MVKMDWVEILHPQKWPFWGGMVEIFSARTKGILKVSEKIFVVPNPFLGSTSLSEPKIADFRRKKRNFWKPFWPKFLHVVVRPAPKDFSEPSYYIQKDFCNPNSIEKSNYEKSHPPPKKGLFFLGGGWNEIVKFRQVNGEQKG